MTRRPLLAAAIAGVSLGAGLLSLVALRWIAFLALPPVFFLNLLLIGMPVGGVLLVRVRWLRERTLSGVILISIGLSVGGGMLFLLVLQLINARVDLIGAELSSLVLSTFLRFLVAVIALFPLFVGYGLQELAAYREGLAGLGGKAAPVYALNLSGLLLSFLAYRLLLVIIGTSGLFAFGLACLLLSAYVLRPRSWPMLAGVAVCVGLVFLPGIEPWTVGALEVKKGEATLNHFLEPPGRLLYDEWTPQGRLAVVDSGGSIAGFFNGMFHWSFTRGLPGPHESPGTYRQMDLVPVLLIRPGDNVAVLGAGGGAQVAAALRAGAGRVFAVEVVPEVLEVLGGPLSAQIENTYQDTRVVKVAKDARRFLDETGQKFDLILSASMESHLAGLRDLVEPSQVMFTREAFQQMKAHLAPGGLLAISRFTAADRRRILFQQCFEQLRRLGLRTRAYLWLASQPSVTMDIDERMARGTQYLVIAQDGTGHLDALGTLDNIFRGLPVEVVAESAANTDLPDITDDRSFSSGLLLANLGIPVLIMGAGAMALLLLLVGVPLVCWLRPTMGGPSPDRRRRGLSLAAAAVGFNFMALETLVAYRLMDRLDNPMDATFVGMVMFASLAAAGAILLARRSSRYLLGTAAALAVVLQGTWFFWPAASLAVLAGAAFVTGSLFPRLLDGHNRELARVYVWDAYGAMWGALAAVVVPLLAGFSGLQVVVGIMLAVAAWAVGHASPSLSGASIP